MFIPILAGYEELKVIPVLDLLDGIVVHAIRGRREEYKPLKSVLCTSTAPLDVATAFKKLGFSELYIADLNAITNNQDNFAEITQVAKKTELQIIVDAGVMSIRKAKTVRDCGVSKVIVGTETLADLSFVEQAIRLFGSDHIIVSFDMKERQLLGKFDMNEFPSAIDVLNVFQGMGLTQIILLDLARVGSREGVDISFLKEVLDNISMQVFVGGGICNIGDLIKLREMGVAGALVATTLHLGKITVEQLKQAGLHLS